MMMILMMMINMIDNITTTSSDVEGFPATPCRRSRTQLLFFSVELIFILLLLPSSVCAGCDQVDKDSILSLALTVSSSSPLNWSASTDCCLWEGILCSPEDGRVTHLWLSGRGFSGVFSPSITNLTYLTHLNISHNALRGPLPEDLFSSLYRLQVLDLSFNHLNGHLPFFSNKASSSSSSSSMFQILDLSSNSFNVTIQPSLLVPDVAAGSLSFFNVSNNNFAGSIPISAFCKNGSNNNNLTLLDFSFNKFNDSISTGLGSFSKLQIFRAGFNALSGPLPDDIFDLTDLQQLSLPVNRLSGPIGDGIVRLTDLQILELYSNQFMGPVPSQIGNLFRLERLVLHINNLTDSLPASLHNCTTLSTLNLRMNFMSGDLSAFNFSTLQRLTTLDLGNNNFTGELPQSLYSCQSLTALRFASNRLTGQISPEIVGLESLSFLSISNNFLTNATGAFRILRGCRNLTTLLLSKSFMNEPLPDDELLSDPDGFKNIQVLGLGGYNFTGQVPSWLAKLKNLQVLDLSFNLITGSIPSWLGSLPNLFYMDLSNNLLAGGFPRELCGLPGLISKEATILTNSSSLEFPIIVIPQTATTLQYNKLSSLPTAIYLGNNSLSGNIPTEIGQLKFILVLDLSHNNFSGSIPDNISNLTNLEKLDLSYNHLSGEIPAGLKGLHFLSSFNVAYNDLQGPVPSGGQFNTFTNSSFEGNKGLCGLMTAHFSCSSSIPSPPSPPSPPVFSVTRFSDKTVTALVFGITFFGISFGISFFIGYKIDDKKVPILGRCAGKLVSLRSRSKKLSSVACVHCIQTRNI